MKKLVTVFMLMICLSSAAQDKKEISEADYNNTEVEMADQFRADGKIYVVVSVMTIILVGLLGYAFIIDKKVSKIEKTVNE